MRWVRKLLRIRICSKVLTADIQSSPYSGRQNFSLPKEIHTNKRRHAENVGTGIT